MKKCVLMLGISLLVVIFILCTIYKATGFIRLKADRERVVELIKSGEIAVQPNGCVVLPDDMAKVSDSGECFLIKFGEETAVYFFSYRGIIDSSRGYVYTTDEISWNDYINIENYVPDIEFSEVIELEGNWYSCYTG